MIEPAPKLSNNNTQEAVKLLVDPSNKDLFTKIDDNYLYWDKIKYMAPAGIKPEVLLCYYRYLNRYVSILS